MVIEQAMGVARSHGNFAAEVLADYVERLKAGGVIAEHRRNHQVAEPAFDAWSKA
jgi:hypothetical protein